MKGIFQKKSSPIDFQSKRFPRFGPTIVLKVKKKDNINPRTRQQTLKKET